MNYSNTGPRASCAATTLQRADSGEAPILPITPASTAQTRPNGGAIEPSNVGVH